MNERDAQEIVRMVESNWGIDLATARGMWRTELLPYEVEQGVRAVAHLAKNLQWRPKLSDLVETLKMFKRRDDEATAKPALVEGKRGTPPEWVWVWSWARFIREPRDERSFPQEADFADSRRMLMQEQYEALRDEWVAAGSPRLKDPFPTIGGSR